VERSLERLSKPLGHVPANERLRLSVHTWPRRIVAGVICLGWLMLFTSCGAGEQAAERQGQPGTSPQSSDVSPAPEGPASAPGAGSQSTTAAASNPSESSTPAPSTARLESPGPLCGPGGPSSSPSGSRADLGYRADPRHRADLPARPARMPSCRDMRPRRQPAAAPRRPAA